MAKLVVALVSTHGLSGKSLVKLPVVQSQPLLQADDITLSGSSQVAGISGTPMAVPDGQAASLFWVVSAYGAAARVKFGGAADPTATNTSGWLVQDGETRFFAATAAGEKAAAILA